jgi:hypothetical protein
MGGRRSENNNRLPHALAARAVAKKCPLNIPRGAAKSTPISICESGTTPQRREAKKEVRQVKHAPPLVLDDLRSIAAL